MIEFTETIKIALRSLKINKMRSALTSLGIIIGVSAVIIMLSIGEGAKAKITKDIESTGSNILTVMSGAATSGGVRSAGGSQPTLTINDSEAILKYCPSVEKISPLVNETKQLVYSNQNWSTTVRGVYPSYTEINKWEIQSGRNLSEDDVKNAAKVCIIGQTVAENLFGDLEPVGRTLRIAGVPFKVIGLLSEKGQNSMGMDQDDTVFIPVTTAQRKLFGTAFPGSVRQINIRAVSAEALDNAEKEIKELLRERHKLGKNEEDDFTIRNFTQMLETVKSATNTMTLLLMAIASVSLLVGGIGIMNIMLVSVTERTKEIGIRSAIGATANDIRLQFLTESVILSLTGGIIGVIAGIVISLLIGTFSNMNIVISYVSVLISFGFAGIIGIIFGYYPAYKASLLRPVEALRYE